MTRRILFISAAAAALLAAAPAFAAETGSSEQPCSCCSDGSNHDVDHPLREGRNQEAEKERTAKPRNLVADPDQWNGSFGG
jgi:hypothetical protein